MYNIQTTSKIESLGEIKTEENMFCKSMYFKKYIIKQPEFDGGHVKFRGYRTKLSHLILYQK